MLKDATRQLVDLRIFIITYDSQEAFHGFDWTREIEVEAEHRNNFELELYKGLFRYVFVLVVCQ